LISNFYLNINFRGNSLLQLKTNNITILKPTFEKVSYFHSRFYFAAESVQAERQPATRADGRLGPDHVRKGQALRVGKMLVLHFQGVLFSSPHHRECVFPLFFPLNNLLTISPAIHHPLSNLTLEYL
jgi:hypothetical protein